MELPPKDIGEPQKPSEPIRVGESFSLFAPERTTLDSNGYTSSITFETQSGLVLPVDFFTYRGTHDTPRRENILTPFNPQLGYIIDPRDFDPEQRVKKIATEYGKPPPEGSFHPEAPLSLDVEMVGVPLEKDPEGMLIFPEESDVQELLLVVSAPLMQVRSQPRIPQIFEDGRVGFHKFLPIDIKHLAEDPSGETNHGEKMPDSFFIFLPDDPRKLAQLKGRFIINPYKQKP